MKNKRGFTLIELIVGTLLVVVVMSAALMLMSTMVQNQLKGARQGRVTGMTALNIETMLTDIRNATYINSAQTNGSTSIGGCDNYSAQDPVYTRNSLSASGVNVAGPLISADPILCFFYCVDGQNNLWGIRNSGPINGNPGCPPTTGGEILSPGNFFQVPPANTPNALSCWPSNGQSSSGQSSSGRPFFFVNMALAQVEANFCVGTTVGTEGNIPSELMVTTAFPMNLGGG